ncbi:HEPN domain-containing protein [Phaeodactylibacter xiamenensis]|uniref:HEPN domain-containing protein n=1 Tax=Phaeodactylibacter xiamenensis TaxID=1524460 RepID=UPI0024A88850|nr:HEPN domain-containing protein [Phaeodactylibacter xiamenensis]
MSYSKNELVAYRAERAREAFEDGRLLAAAFRWNSAANRLYYACFYIVSAYLVQRGIRATTHSGLKTAFNKELIKTGKISKEEGRLFNKLFGLRQEADYEDFHIMEKEDIEPLLPKIERLLKEIENILGLDQEV